MISRIRKALENQPAIKAWIIRQEISRSFQQYDLKDRSEAVREVDTEIYTVDVLCDSEDSEGKISSGLGTVSILPGGDIESTLEKAILTAQLVHNEPYDFAAPAAIPEIELADPAYQKDPEKELGRVLATLKEASKAYPHVRLTAAECFGQERQTHLVSSKGIDASQTATDIYLQWVYIGGEGQDEVETFAEIQRRRTSDLNLEEAVSRQAQSTLDLVQAGKPQSYTGPVVIQGSTLADMIAGEMLSGSLLGTLSNAGLKYSGETPWEVGKSIFRQEVKGDDFTIWANRKLAFGVPSSAFDKEGIPAQRVPLIQENKLVSFIADQRYAYYLGIKPTGSFGCMEMPAGNTSLADLQTGSYVEIAEFSWFNPNRLNGNFACEIRLGYLVEEGKRKPFKGGMLVGNLLDALADVIWSSEVGFYGNYLGPRGARFNSLRVTE
ncbi:MAG TPA: hypothetical protein ENG59_03390 [Chloroflexi bacterium]|nr:hypothetical protein [Chloroflexota bacterium]